MEADGNKDAYMGCWRFGSAVLAGIGYVQQAETTDRKLKEKEL